VGRKTIILLLLILGLAGLAALGVLALRAYTADAVMVEKHSQSRL
jgi:hypothetical protein